MNDANDWPQEAREAVARAICKAHGAEDVQQAILNAAARSKS